MLYMSEQGDFFSNSTFYHILPNKCKCFYKRSIGTSGFQSIKWCNFIINMDDSLIE